MRVLRIRSILANDGLLVLAFSSMSERLACRGVDHSEVRRGELVVHSALYALEVLQTSMLSGVVRSLAVVVQRKWLKKNRKQHDIPLFVNTIFKIEGNFTDTAIQVRSSTCYPRDAMLARVIAIATCLSVRLSVCLSVTRRYCVKTKKVSGMISSPSGSPKTLVF